MAGEIREILLLGRPELWRLAEPVADVRAREAADLAADLGATLADFRDRKGFGRAIAAPQIGVPWRVIFLAVGPKGPLYNPVLVQASAEQMELWDDCFSFPDLLVRVRRSAEVTVRYLDEHAIARTLSARGEMAELLQHEIDHLDGILATERAIGPRALAMRAALGSPRRSQIQL